MDLLANTGVVNVTQRHSRGVTHRNFGLRSCLGDFWGGMCPLNLTERHSRGVTHRNSGPLSRLGWTLGGAWVP